MSLAIERQTETQGRRALASSGVASFGRENPLRKTETKENGTRGRRNENDNKKKASARRRDRPANGIYNIGLEEMIGKGGKVSHWPFRARGHILACALFSSSFALAPRQCIALTRRSPPSERLLPVPETFSLFVFGQRVIWRS